MSTRNTLFLSIAATALFATAAAAQQPTAKHQAAAKPAVTSSQPAPKISADSARKIALANNPDAKVKSEKLHKEGGKREYVFRLAQPKGQGTTRAMVDAETGAYTKIVPSSASTVKKDTTAHKMTKPQSK
jgi:uncharacterized membrane protein YkoI